MFELERFAGPDLNAAQAAFAKLASAIEPVLSRSLRSILPRESDREDAISATLEKLWEKRTAFIVIGAKQWWSYVITVGRRCALGLARRETPAELNEDLSSADSLTIETFAGYRYDREKMYRLADELWLGIKPELEERDRKRRLLAAQLFYLHDQPPHEIIAILGPGVLTRDELDDWLSEAPTLRDLCFNELYIENETLASIILGIDFDMSLADVDRLAENSAPPAGWTWKEVRVVLARYRNGLLADKILQMFPDLTNEEFEAVVLRCSELLPFVDRARQVQRSLKNRRVGTEPLADIGLSKRLVFGYWAAYDLPRKQILERTEPPASVLGYRLTDNSINAWIGNERLSLQLAKYAEAQNAN